MVTRKQDTHLYLLLFLNAVAKSNSDASKSSKVMSHLFVFILKYQSNFGFVILFLFLKSQMTQVTVYDKHYAAVRKYMKIKIWDGWGSNSYVNHST